MGRVRETQERGPGAAFGLLQDVIRWKVCEQWPGNRCMEAVTIRLEVESI